MIEADRERIAQVLGNLMGNALRYTPAGGTITLSAEAGEGVVLLRVSDTGPGIEPEHCPISFSASTGRMSSRPTNGELGLGLAIAKSLVEAHDGTIQVESAVGQGATFTVALPASDGELASTALHAMLSAINLGWTATIFSIRRWIIRQSITQILRSLLSTKAT